MHSIEDTHTLIHMRCDICCFFIFTHTSPGLWFIHNLCLHALCHSLLYALSVTRKLRFSQLTLIPWGSVLDYISCNMQSCEYGDNSINTDFVLTPTTLHALRAKSLQSCSILCKSMNYSPLGSSICGILRAEILDGIAMFSSRGSSWPRDQTYSSFISWIGR